MDRAGPVLRKGIGSPESLGWVGWHRDEAGNLAEVQGRYIHVILENSLNNMGI